jgi:diguanylate cyclase (GGDEF)-like protein
MKDDILPTGDSHEIYAELTRLNNQLLTMQRELEKKNCELERLAYYDTLTGLLNRRAILEKLDEWLRQVRRYSDRLSVVMVDLDHFKHVNDTFGHRTGDRVLADIAGLMRRSVRQADFCGRYGGEEFLVLLPQTDVAGAAVMSERMRTAVEGTPMHIPEGGTFQITASFGAAEYCDGDDEDLLVGRADAALYRAKECGRNRTEIASCAPTDG